MKTKNNKRTQYPVRTAKPGKTAKTKQMMKFVRTSKLWRTVNSELADQIARITEMEALFTKCEMTVRQFRQAIENKADINPDLTNFASVLIDLLDFKDLISATSSLNTPAQSFDLNDLTSALSTLEAYYTSPAWRTDFEADEAGLLPPDLKRGVLSEDGLYNLLEDFKWVEEEVKEMF